MDVPLIILQYDSDSNSVAVHLYNDNDYSHRVQLGN